MKDIFITKHLYLILLLLLGVKLQGQNTCDTVAKHKYLSVQSGLLIDSYNNVGLRTFFEYQQDLKGNWQYGVSYENTSHLHAAATDVLELLSNLRLLSVNSYYKLNLIKDRLFWTVGMGAGAIHVNWENENRFGVTLNASITLNFRILKNIYIETSPLTVLLPVNRLYYSPLKINQFDQFYGYTLLPIGVKVKL
jgi:hypothetical protein